MPPDRLERALLAELSAVGLGPTPQQIEALLNYLTLVEKWRKRARLTAITDTAKAARLHIADSLLALRGGIAAGASIIDVGSGAGFPGIPLKIIRPDLDLTLLEPDARRAGFLEIASVELSLRTRVVAARGEDAARDPSLREHFEIATARAVAALSTICELTLPFVRMGGKAVLLKGPSVRYEITDGQASAFALGGRELELIEAQLGGSERRFIVVVQKIAPTPQRFPRRSGVLARRRLNP